jgi:hypothetical protein
MKNNWLVFSGQAKIEKEEIIYIPIERTDEKGSAFFETANVSSDIDFENGTIEFTVKVEEPNAICQIVLNTEKTENLNIGLNAGSLYGITKYNNETKRWEWQSGQGFSENLDICKEHNFKIAVTGSLISLFVNNIKVSESSQDIRKGQLKFFISSSKEVKIKNLKIASIKPKAFIVMQFSEEFNKLYSEVIKPICEEYGLECERADEFYTSTPIIADIVTSIIECSLIIAEITPDNPNVYYELGYAHAINKPSILLCDRGKRNKLPFDISGYRTLFYEDTIFGKTAIENTLRKYLESIL